MKSLTEFNYTEEMNKQIGFIPLCTDILHRCKSHAHSSQEQFDLFWAYSLCVFQSLLREVHLSCTDISSQSACYYMHIFHTCMCHYQNIVEHPLCIPGRTTDTKKQTYTVITGHLAYRIVACKVRLGKVWADHCGCTV